MRIKSYKQFLLVIILMMTSHIVSAENIIQPFVKGSFSEILKNTKGKPFVLVLWSLDCPSCFKELKMLGEIHWKNPQIKLVLVSTDIEANETEIQPVMVKYKLENIESWVFRDESDERLRYEIDRNWYGELPRSYFFNAADERQVVSGVLTKEQLKKWFGKINL